VRPSRCGRGGYNFPTNMTPETITKKIHDKADKDLRDKINLHINALWKIADAHSTEKPTREGHPALDKALSLAGYKISVPWIGDINSVIRELAFSHARDKNRENATFAFMAKIEAMADQFEELGMVVTQRDNEE